MKNYYKILNVSKNATSEEIRRKYIKKARKYHPDKNKDEKSLIIYQLITLQLKLITTFKELLPILF